MRGRRLALIAVLVGATWVAFGATPARAQKPGVSIIADVTPKSGTMADQYVLTIEISITGISGYDKFFPPRFNDWSTADVSTRQSTQWLYDPARGQEIKNVEIRRYVLVPRRAGKLKIEEALVKVRGDEFQTKQMIVDVESSGQPSVGPTFPGGPSQPLPATTNKDLFIEATVDKQKIVVGEQVVVVWKLFMATDELKQYRTTQEPQTDGFWVEELAQPTHFTYTDEQRGGRHFTTAVVLKKALFPLRAGQLIIGSLSAQVETFGGSASNGEEVRAAPIVLDVAPAPALNRPPGFEPPNVGKFTIKASADPTNTTNGDPIMLSVEIEGQGNVRGLKIPALIDLAKALPGFRVFQPKIDETIAVDDDVVGGKRSYLFRLQPQQNGEFNLPALELVYFDPAERSFEVARANAIPVAVSGVTAPPPGTAAGDPGDPRRNVIDAPRIHGQVYSSSLASRQRQRFHQQPLFWLLLLMPPLCLLGVIAIDRVRVRMSRDTPRTRMRRAAGRARKAMRLCELHIKGDRPAKFFGELSRALTDHLEDRLGTPVAGMTRDILRQTLAARSFPEDTMESLVRELENCDFARFAPSASGPGEMKAALRRAKTLLTAIERAPVKALESEEAA